MNNSDDNFVSNLKKIASLGFLFTTFICSILFISTDEAGAVEHEKPTDVVYRLYKDYAWQALIDLDEDSARIFGKYIRFESRAVLEKYFDTELAALFIADVNYTVLTGEMGGLNSDPIFNTQDHGVIDFKIHPFSSGNILVEYTYILDLSKISLIYKVKHYPQGWRITDIVYKSSNNKSLKKILQGSETALKIWKMQKQKGSASQ